MSVQNTHEDRSVNSAQIDKYPETPVAFSSQNRLPSLSAIGIGSYALIATLGVLFLIRVIGMFTIPFTDTTEARYTEIARKMVETGDWITPQFDYGIPFWGKPPLHTWLSALGMEVFGVNAFGARVFIFVTALTLLLFFAQWLARYSTPRTALYGVAVLYSSGLFYGASAFVMTDMAMTFGTTLAMVGIWYTVQPTDGQPAAASLWGYLVFVGVAIGLLAKGPVALVLILIPLGLWSLKPANARRLKRLPWFRGSLLCLALTLPWYVLAELKTPGFLNYFLIGEHFERFTVPDWQGDLYGSGHERAKGAIWGGWLIAFFPWSLALIGLLFALPCVVGAFRKDDTGLRTYLLLWAISPMILFTPAANILAAYVLPGLPAASALLVLLWGDVFGLKDKAGTRSFTPVSRFFFGLGLTIPVVVFLPVSILAVTHPAFLNLKSQRELVAFVTERNPEATLTYVGFKSYSGQFYTQGQAQSVPDLNAASSLLSNGKPDVLAIHAKKVPTGMTDGSSAWHRQGEIGRYVLFSDADFEEGVK